MNYKCVEIPEPDFDASFTDEMVVAAYQDEDDFNPQMLDEYPNVRLTQLETDIQQTSLTAAEAFETANNAEELATQASQAATTANESANAAGNLASQAAQTAQEAEGIAESAATTAGEAAQSINEHASSTTNPHPANTTQSFAEVVITPLKSDANGGSVADADYNWFKGVYASLVDGSVLSWIKGLVNQVKSLATRVGLLEDKYILKYVVPVNTTSIELTTDKYGNAFNFGIGERFKVYINGKSNTDESYATLYLQINNISTPQWLYAGSSVYSAILGYCCAYFTNIWDLEISTDSIQARLTSNRSNSALNNFFQHTLTLMSKPISIGGTIKPPVTSIKIITSYTIYAGSEIIIKTK